MPVLAAFAILLTYNCSAPITLPLVQQWRSDTFSSASKCQLSLPKNWQILLTGCWHTQHHTKTTSASLHFINLPKKHIRRKSNTRYYPTMPVKQTISICFPNAKRGSILMEDAGLTLNNKKLWVRPTQSPIVLWDRCCRSPTSPCRQQQLGSLPPCHSCSPWPMHQSFSGNKGPTKTKIAAERKAAKEATQKESNGKKAATATCKADGLAKKQEKRISSAKAKASTAAAKAEALRSKLVDVIKSAAIPEAAHHHKKSKGMLGTLPTNSTLAHTLPFSPQWKLMSAKKRVSMQSPLRSSYDKEDGLGLSLQRQSRILTQWSE
jgi:hypothetical protein